MTLLAPEPSGFPSPLAPQQAMSRCVHCAADLISIPGVGWVHPDGQRGVLLPSGDYDHLAVPVGRVPGVARRLGLA